MSHSRGIILGMALNMDGSLVSSGRANVVSIRSQVDVNGTRVVIGTRPRSFKGGLFSVPFTWDAASNDNFVRVVNSDILTVNMSVFREEGAGGVGAFFTGVATSEEDGVELLASLKMGKLVMSGTLKDAAKILRPQLKDAVKGDEFAGMPLSQLSIERKAIVGVVIAKFTV